MMLDLLVLWIVGGIDELVSAIGSGHNERSASVIVPSVDIVARPTLSISSQGIG
jgi:hypothetical protein